jgi:hypothetical protein
MWDLLARYYGLDWAATIVTLISIYALGDGKRSGFALGMAGALLWCVFGVLAASAAGALLNAILFGLFLRGYLKWGGRGPSRASG